MIRPDYADLSLRHFQTFISVAEESSMAVAAEKMHVSQPLLSRRISQLEKVLGFQLFMHQKHGLMLTEAGTLLLKECKELVKGVEDALDKSYAVSVKSKCCARIGFSDNQGSFHVQSIMERLRGFFPDMQFDFVISWLTVTRKQLLRGEIDLLYATDIGKDICDDKSLNYIKLYDLKAACLVDNTHTLSSRKSVTLSDLKGQKCYWTSSLRNIQITKDLQRVAKEREVNLKWEFKDLDYFAFRKYLYIGDGVSFTLNTEIETDPKLRLLEITDCNLSYPFVVAWSKNNDKRLEKYANAIAHITANLV